jgi:hypothetical protein
MGVWDYEGTEVVFLCSMLLLNAEETTNFLIPSGWGRIGSWEHESPSGLRRNNSYIANGFVRKVLKHNIFRLS